jgi:hypothetical protein
MRAAIFAAGMCAMLALSACRSDNGPSGNDTSSETSNETSERDAAPGGVSETSPPSTAASDPAQSQPSTDIVDQPPHR